MRKVEIDKLCFSYENKQVLKGLNLELTEEQPTVLLGESGRGKTTLMRLLLGLNKPDSGEIRGIDENTRIAVVFQEDRLFPHLTVYKNMKLIKKDLSREEAAVFLKQLNLGDSVLDMLPNELSGGMRRRIALARALIFDAEIIFMDEPFQGLDPETRKMAAACVREHTEGKILLVISHDEEDAEMLGAKCVKLEEICR